MEYKKSMIILILTIFLSFAISGVCAGDVNDTLMVSHDNAQIELSQNDNQDTQPIQQNDNVDNLAVGKTVYVNSSSTGGSGTLDDPFDSLADAIDACGDGDTIMIASGTYVGAKNTGLTINQTNLVLMGYGNGEVIFDAQHSGRILNVNSDGIIINGLTFQNAWVDGNGGAICFNNGLVNSNIDATFKNNNATQAGGAIYFGGNLTNVTLNGWFDNNSLDAKGIGGAANFFYGSLSNVTISGLFTNSKIKYKLFGPSGANYFNDTLTDVFLLASFINNSASDVGANYFQEALNNVTLKGQYVNNSGNYGGANWFIGSLTNVIIDGNFSNNEVIHSDGGVNKFNNELVNVSISGSFSYNKANGNGAANHFAQNVTNLSISGDFTGNVAGNIGGANSFLKPLMNVTITGNFTHNRAAASGGANYFHGDMNNVSLSGIFNNNSIFGYSASGGGANSFDGLLRDVTISGVFTNNSASDIGERSSGGANGFFSHLLKNVTITGNFTNNSANSYGGANFFRYDLEDVVISGNFTSNCAQFSGGANGFSGTLHNSTISGIFCDNRAVGSSEAGGSGGANYFSGGLMENVNMTGIYRNNIAMGETFYEGGGANKFGCSMTNVFINAEFTNNTAKAGGANRFTGQLLNVFITGNFTNNTSKDWDHYYYLEGGGANYFSNVINSTISGNYTGNKASLYGAANSFFGTMINVNVTGNYTNNNAELYGGAIRFDGEISNVNVTGNYTNNTAGKGGAVFIGNSQGSFILSGIFSKNCAVEFGGAFYNDNDNCTVVNACFVNNSASQGGAIYSTGIECNVSGCNFTYNLADVNGGAVSWNGIGGCVFDCSFMDNRVNGSDNRGGAVYASSDLSILKSRFSDNSAQNGGAVYFYMTSGNISDCSFEDNFAYYPEGSGGAVCLNGTNATVSNCRFENNFANHTGGAIDLTGSNGVIFNCYFVNNDADVAGGAIESYGSRTCVLSSIFVNNSAVNGSAFSSRQGQSQASNSTLNNNIFLNNKEGIDIYLENPENSSIDYNWFGNTADNYQNCPVALVGISNTWLFLNATANPNPAPVFSNAVVVFKLYVYNESGVFEYDNNLVIPVNLTLNVVNGEIDRKTADIAENITFSSDTVGTACVSAAIETVSYDFDFMVGKIKANLTVLSQEVTYGDNITFTLDYNSNATGKVNITLKGKKIYDFLNMDLNNTIRLTEAIDAGEYEVEVFYGGDATFLNETANSTLKVNRANSTLSLNGTVFDYGGVGFVAVSYSNATGLLAEVFNQTGAVVNISGNVITVSGLNAGNYTLKVTTVTNDNYNNVTGFANITVNKIATQIMPLEFTTTYNTDNELVITLKDSMNNPVSNAQITVDFNGVSLLTTDNNGQVRLSTGGLDVKTYTVAVTYAGDDNHVNSTGTVKVTVEKATPKIIAKKKTYRAKKKIKKFTVTLKDNKNMPIKKAKLTIQIKKIAKKSKKSKKKSHKKKSKKKKKRNTAVTNKKGKATFKIDRKKKGKYRITVKYKGNEYYKPVTKKVRIVIK